MISTRPVPNGNVMKTSLEVFGIGNTPAKLSAVPTRSLLQSFFIKRDALVVFKDLVFCRLAESIANDRFENAVEREMMKIKDV